MHKGFYKGFIAVFTGLAIVVAAAATASAQTEVIFAISAKPGSLQYETATEFTRLANDRLTGKAVVKFFGASQLGKDKDLLQKLKLGSVHIALPSSIMSSIADEFGLFDMPFIVKDREHVKQIDEKIFWQMIAPAAEAKGYKVLALWENGIRQITNNVRPIDTPADLDGIKLRTPKGKWRVRMFKEWGGNPTPMAFSEVFVALQTKVIDGQENPLTNIYAAKFQEVQKYLSMTGHVYSPAYPTVGLKPWNELPGDVRAILEQTAKDVQPWMYQKGAEGDRDLRTKLEAAGMKVNNADRAAFVTASRPVYEAFAAEVPGGQDLIDAALKLAK
ncbi:MAG: TRAP transporter substrate-binding protein [Rhodospirillales bacterium]|nr:TRAP transporter substrate-binding protein [Paracoccaceae bacterium]MDH3910800.1 TRAP transporter substrate-binding protein [Rhodospirillales bacterium]MDH3919545.1 TRAP transporter substrate-binding protein [Rhodospirillales bacterium]MDH3970342.1 TRAP transporter substrate-binding protein [Rhodospirillales bacterium]